MRSDEHMNAKVRQIVRSEQDIRLRREALGAMSYPDNPRLDLLDELFTQADGFNCLWCPMKAKCWEPNSDDLYQPRNPNHPLLEVE